MDSVYKNLKDALAAGDLSQHAFRQKYTLVRAVNSAALSAFAIQCFRTSHRPAVLLQDEMAEIIFRCVVTDPALKTLKVIAKPLSSCKLIMLCTLW